MSTAPTSKQTVPAAPVPVTLDNCSTEPIRIPGSIQRHGFLLGLDEPQDHIVLASENAEEFLDTPLKLILGSTLDLLVDRELVGAIRQQRCAVEPDGMVSYLGTYRIRKELFSVVTHCIEGKRVLEFERQDRLVGSEMMNTIITNFVGTLSKLDTQEELCAAVTQQIAQLTGFNRVMLYCFDEEGHGTVLSEANNGILPSYLDLRFPATDIPQQARELYVLNTVRIIPDATYTPSPIRSLSAEEAPHILDLSLAVLRSVSPIHLEYMRNMGTASSMSISIVSEGRLWGLISGHHATPRMVPYLVRSACDMLSKLVGTQLTTFRTSARLATLMNFHAVQRQLLTQVAAEFNYLSALAAQLESLRQITSAEGAALWIDGRCETNGRTPSCADIGRIVEWLDTRNLEQFATRHLSADLPWAIDLADYASGLLAIRISDVRQRYVLWFRPQVIRTVRWAGEPVKVLAPNATLHPRKSFEIWRETFHGQSLQWTEAEQESAREFRAAIVTVSLKRAEEEAELSAARFEQLTHALPAKIFTADDSGNLIYTNQRWRDQGLSISGCWYGNHHLVPEDEPRVNERWKHSVATGEDFEEEVRFVTGQGAERWNLVRAVPFKRQGAARAGWVGSVVDLTERREREAALRMTEKLALTGRMTSVIAHEINNPLESITNLLYLVRMGLTPGSDSEGYINQAESELERISGITKQTLRWGRENSLAAEKFTAGSVFTDVLRLFRGKIQNRHVTATVLGGEDILLEGILGQIRQVVANLVSNAVDAAPVGGAVSIQAKEVSGDNIEIAVTDNGNGIPSDLQEQLFQPFVSTKGDLGNGLGLYISREIVERHGGTFRVETAQGAGTTMHILLPRTAQIESNEADIALLS